MTVIDQLKILDNKIRANKAQYDLDREAAKISALSSGELEKYEYLSGQDFGYKPDIIEKAKFEYSRLAKVFNKGLDESDKKEGLLKRLKNIENKNHINIEDKTNSELTTTKSGFARLIKDLTPEQNKVINEIKKQDSLINYRGFFLKERNGKTYDFRGYDSLLELLKKLYLGENIRFAVDVLEMDIEDLEKKYKPIDDKYEDSKKNLLNNVKELYEGRQMIIDACRKDVLKPSEEIDEKDKEDEEDLWQNSEESVKLRRQESNKLNKIITKKDKITDKNLFTKHFQFRSLSDMQKPLS